MGTVGNKEMRTPSSMPFGNTQTNRNCGELSKLGKFRRDSIKIVHHKNKIAKMNYSKSAMLLYASEGKKVILHYITHKFKFSDYSTCSKCYFCYFSEISLSQIQ